MFIAGGLGANPHPALALEEFTAKEDLLPTIEAVLRVFDQTGNRDNKLRARLKWVVDDARLRRGPAPGPQGRATSCWPRRPGPAASPRPSRSSATRRPACATGVTPTPIGQGTPVALRGIKPYERWVDANVVRGAAKGTVSAIRLRPARRHHDRPVPGPRLDHSASSASRCASPTGRTSCFRGLTEAQLPTLFARLDAIGMAQPGAELARDVVACPGADTCNLAVTQSRGLADAIGAALEDAGLAEVGGVRTNISGCTNSCGQHHTADIGFFGAERRAHGQAAPGYQMLLGGYVGQEQIHFGQKALRLPAENAPEATVRVVRRFADEREAGEDFRGWLDRVRRRRKAIAEGLRDLDEFPSPTRPPSSTSTSARPAPTSPRSANRSAPHDRHGHT